MPKTRRERRAASKAAYLDGRARNPHHHTLVLKRSLEEPGTSPSASVGASPVLDTSSSSSMCPQCKPVLSQYVDAFKGMVHQGSELKRKMTIDPNPKRAETTHYRDLVSQNEWLKQNMFDALGNYVIVRSCLLVSTSDTRGNIH